MTGPYAEGARLYWGAGWPNPIPVRGKRIPASGFTGYEGDSVSFVDLSSWLEGPEAEYNIALRMAGTIGIDVDAHDGEIGNVTLERAQSALGDLPPTWSTTSRGAGASRILIYRLPIGCGDLHRELEHAEKNLIQSFGPNVEVLHRGHRYAIAWPSVHPDTGQVYQWYKPNGEPAGEVPKFRDITELPLKWWDFLTRSASDAVSTKAPPLSPAERSSVEDRLFGTPEVHNRRTRATAQAILSTALQEFKAPDADGRASRLLPKLALIAGHGVPGGFWTEEDVRQQISEAAEACGYVDKHGRVSLDTQLTRGLADGAQDPWVLIEVSEPAAPAQTNEESSWDVVDVSPVLAGEFKRLEPELGMRSDGVRLLYRAKEHAIASEPECGKTWWVLLQVRNTLNGGGRVVYLDFEDDENTIVGRLLMLGTSPELLGTSTFRYVRPDSKPPAGVISSLCTFGAEAFADLLILDGMTEGLGLMGLSALDQEAIVTWRRVFVKPAMRLGAATLTTDHVVKQADSRGRFAIGAQHKLAGLNGVMFVMSQVHPFGAGLEGMSLVSITKDRNGSLRGKGQPGPPGLTEIGLLRSYRSGQESRWDFVPPKERTEQEIGDLYPGLEAKLIPTVNAVIEYIAENPNVSQTTVRQALPKSARSVGDAIAWLRDKHVIESQPGPGGGRLYSIDAFVAAAENKIESALKFGLKPTS